MNRILHLLVAIFLVANSYASTTEKCHCGLTKYVENYQENNSIYTQDDNKIKELTQEEIKGIRNRLCMNIFNASSFGLKPDEFKKEILTPLGFDIHDPNANKIVSSFLNKYKQKMVCPKDPGDLSTRDLHLYKTAIINGVIDLFDEILFDDDEYQIDFNAFEIVDGKKETVLDYLDKLLSTTHKGDDDLELLRDDIIDFGGRRASEL